MADNKVSIEISLEGNAQVQFKKLGDSAETFATQTKKSFLDAGRIFDNFIANLGSNAVSGALNLLHEGFSSFNGVLAESIKASSEQEDAINSLNSALALSGKYSKATSQELQAFASQLQSTTKYGDEAILGVTSLISTLGKLDKEGLKNATKATLDLAAGLNIDLKTAAELVGKAADGNVGVLKRYGVEVKDTGDKARDFAAVLQKVQQNFGGRANAEVNTFSGAVAQLKNSYGDALEVIGDTVTKSPAVLAAFKFIGEEVKLFTKYLESNKEGVNSFVTQGLLFLVEALKAVVFAVQAAVGSFKVIEGSLQVILNSVVKVGNAVGVFKLFGNTAQALGENLEKDTAGGVDKVVNAFEGFGTANTVLDELKAKIEAVTEASAAGAEAADAIRNAKIQQATEDAITEEARKQNAVLSQETEQSQALQSYTNYLISRNAILAKSDTDASKKSIEENNKKLKEILASDFSSTKNKLQISDKFAEDDIEIEKRRSAAKLNILTNLATLQNAKTKEVATIGKAAAISEATIKTYLAANEAYAALAGIPVVGPALGAVAAGAAIAAGLINVSNIAGVGLATGIDQVPPGFQNDTFPARLSSGERVVSAPQNKDLTEFLSGNSGLTARIDQLIGVLSSNSGITSINIDGREIITAIQDQLDSGRALNV